MTEGNNQAETAGISDARTPTSVVLFSGAWTAAFGALALFTAPTQYAEPVYLPATLETAGTAAEQEARPATPIDQSVDFIVRFDDVAEVQTCLDTFRTEPADARSTFSQWAGGYETLKGMKLKKTSYAGELILSWSTEDGSRPNRADIIAKQQALLAMPEVKYADPDYTAHAGDTP